MNLPSVIKDLVTAQNNFDSAAYADCFSETATVHDEGHNHVGKKEIQEWIAEANAKYGATMKPLGYEENGNTAILKAEASGSFPGSPLVMQYHLQIKDGLIDSLKITG